MVTVKELQEQLKVSVGELQASFKAETEALKQAFDVKINEQAIKITDLQATVDLLSVKLSKIEKKCEDEDAYKRRDVVVISGAKIPLVSPHENCTEIAISQLKSELNVDLSHGDISTAHRLGKVKPNVEDRRNIVIKLCRRDDKRKVMDASRRVKPVNFYVSEHLTPMRNTIMYALRMMKKKNGSRVVGCFSYNGQVYAWVKPPNGTEAMKVEVESRNKLEHVSLTFAGAPLTQFVNHWRH